MATGTSAAEFTRMLLLEILVETQPEYITPSFKQLNYVDILGVEPNKWEHGVSVADMRRMIDEAKTWAADFFALHNAHQATGLQKELLRHKVVEFNVASLMKAEALKLYIANTGGIRLDQMKILRHQFKIPIQTLANLTRVQAQVLIEKMKTAYQEGKLSDVLAIVTEDDDMYTSRTDFSPSEKRKFDDFQTSRLDASPSVRKRLDLSGRGNHNQD